MSLRHRKVDQNPHFKSVERAMRKLSALTPKEARFIQDIHRKGPAYNMSNKQYQWLNSIMTKV